MDGSAADESRSTNRDAWVALLCHHFDSWGLKDAVLARTAAERVMQALHRRGTAFGSVDPLQLATRWIQAMADDGSGDSSDWFFRAPALLSRFPAAFLETDVPDAGAALAIDFLPELAPLAMPEQEVIGPITHAVRVATEAMEGAMEGVAAQRTGAETRLPGGS
ncbi:MAG TPA: hypothetical protein VHC69_11970 [Polyangiaceae bacterium]|nr:hypothetical protein [Polyangiaceae bacterium]